jgi:hypothetical protein
MAASMIGSYKMTVDGTDVSDEIFGTKGSSVVYRDNMGLVSDTMDITLIDSNLDMADLFPEGASVEAEFTTGKGRTLKTGTLFRDTESGTIGSSSEEGSGNSVSLGSNSQPEKRPGMRTFIAYNKKKVTLETLLKDVLDKAGLKSTYRFLQFPFMTPWPVDLKNIIIQNETVGAILRQYADLFGCYLKVYDDGVIFTNKDAFLLDPVLKILSPSETSVRNFRYDINEHQYNEYDVSYYNPRTGKTTGDKKSKKSILITESETVKRITTAIADANAARALAMAVDGQRQAQVTFNTDGDETAIAGAVWQINELKKLTGRYVIMSAAHTIADNWTVEISAENIF